MSRILAVYWPVLMLVHLSHLFSTYINENLKNGYNQCMYVMFLATASVYIQHLYSGKQTNLHTCIPNMSLLGV